MYETLIEFNIKDELSNITFFPSLTSQQLQDSTIMKGIQLVASQKRNKYWQ